MNIKNDRDLRDYMLSTSKIRQEMQGSERDWFGGDGQ